MACRGLSRFAARFVPILLLAVSAVPARAERKAQRLETTYRDAFSPELGKAHVVEVPLVPREGAQLVMAKQEHMKRLGFLRAPFGREDKGYEARVLSELALRRATDAEVAAGKVKYIGLATRYADAHGSARGDGKAAIVGDLVLKDARTGRIEGIFEVQLKGVDTGLRPNGVEKKHTHGTGAERVDEAVRQALMSEYLLENGVKATDWLAVIRLGERVEYEHEDGSGRGSYESGLLVRAGNLLRIAHLQHFKRDPKLLRELVAHVNREASRELGRRTLMPLDQLYRHLLFRKAHDLADMYWARAVHGSLTIDNIGLFEHLDLGTTHTVDGKNSTFLKWRMSPGYAAEAPAVLAWYYEGGPGYQGALHELLRSVARSPGELRRLDAMRGRWLGNQEMRDRMVVKALTHAGFDADDLAALERGGQRANRQRFRDSLEQLVYGNVDDVGTFDVFNVMANLVEITASDEPLDERVQRLGTIMRRRGGTTDYTHYIARGLILATEPLLKTRLRGLSPGARRAKLRLMTGEARRINRPVSLIGQQHASSSQFLRRMETLTREGKGARLRAESRAWVRENTRTGAQSAGAVATRLRRGELRRLDTARVVLTSMEENGVRMEEISDGADDTLRVTISGARGAAWDMTLELNGQEQVRRGRRTARGYVFEVPIREPLASVRATFVDTRTGKAVDNAGFGFGRGTEWALGSPLVRAELAAYADRRGRQREGADPAEIEAVSRRGATATRTASGKARRVEPKAAAPRRGLPVIRDARAFRIAKLRSLHTQGARPRGATRPRSPTSAARRAAR